MVTCLDVNQDVLGLLPYQWRPGVEGQCTTESGDALKLNVAPVVHLFIEEAHVKMSQIKSDARYCGRVPESACNNDGNKTRFSNARNELIELAFKRRFEQLREQSQEKVELEWQDVFGQFAVVEMNSLLASLEKNVVIYGEARDMYADALKALESIHNALVEEDEYVVSDRVVLLTEAASAIQLALVESASILKTVPPDAASGRVELFRQKVERISDQQIDAAIYKLHAEGTKIEPLWKAEDRSDLLRAARELDGLRGEHAQKAFLKFDKRIQALDVSTRQNYRIFLPCAEKMAREYLQYPPYPGNDATDGALRYFIKTYQIRRRGLKDYLDQVENVTFTRIHEGLGAEQRLKAWLADSSNPYRYAVLELSQRLEKGDLEKSVLHGLNATAVDFNTANKLEESEVGKVACQAKDAIDSYDNERWKQVGIYSIDEILTAAFLEYAGLDWQEWFPWRIHPQNVWDDEDWMSKHPDWIVEENAAKLAQLKTLLKLQYKSDTGWHAGVALTPQEMDTLYQLYVKFGLI
jgi:hypothetical protein